MRQQHDELLVPLPRHRVLGAQCFAKTLSDHLQQPVHSIVAERCAEGFESIEIDEQHSQERGKAARVQPFCVRLSDRESILYQRTIR